MYVKKGCIKLGICQPTKKRKKGCIKSGHCQSYKKINKRLQKWELANPPKKFKKAYSGSSYPTKKLKKWLKREICQSHKKIQKNRCIKLGTCEPTKKINKVVI